MAHISIISIVFFYLQGVEVVMIKYFYGGIHNSDGSDKSLTNQLPIKEYIPDSVEISMQQSSSKICDIVVKKGDKVTKGQLIGQPSSFATTSIHASIDGIVSDVKITKDSFDNEVPVVVITSNGETIDKEGKDEGKDDLEYKKAIVNIDNISKETILNSIEDGGLIGLGGAGFPTHIKYDTPKEIQHILINASECEPYLTCDHRLMLESAYDIINGIRLLLKLSNAKKAFICIEDNKKDAVEEFESILDGKGLPIEVMVLPTRYPQGGERQLIQAVFNKEVPAGKLTADLGIIVNNVGTVKALSDIMFANEPLISRVVTVTGNVKEPSNFRVPIGTSYRELIMQAGGYTIDNTRLILGGPMMGENIQIAGKAEDLEGSVAKTTSGLIAIEDYTLYESNCIRCGECERVCPAGLSPYKIDFAAINNDIVTCDRLCATECISCGCCSYVCPAKRELAYRITMAKSEIFSLRQVKGGN